MPIKRKKKKVHAKPKKPYKFSFIQDWGTYTNETFVIVGMKHDEIVRAMKRHHFKEFAIKSFDKDKKENEAKWLNGKNNGMTWQDDEGRTILWFLDWKNDWSHYDVLIHEIVHLIDAITKQKNMSEEMEARAYLAEYLWRSIRRQIHKRT